MRSIGWRRESYRHSLAARGIRTNYYASKRGYHYIPGSPPVPLESGEDVELARELVRKEERIVDMELRFAAERKLDDFYRDHGSARLRDAWRSDPEFRKAMVDAEVKIPRREIFGKEDFDDVGDLYDDELCWFIKRILFSI